MVNDNATVVTAAILLRGDDVLLARRPVGDRLAGHWELPGGKLEPGESPEECLARELTEELGGPWLSQPPALVLDSLSTM